MFPATGTTAVFHENVTKVFLSLAVVFRMDGRCWCRQTRDSSSRSLTATTPHSTTGQTNVSHTVLLFICLMYTSGPSGYYSDRVYTSFYVCPDFLFHLWDISLLHVLRPVQNCVSIVKSSVTESILSVLRLSFSLRKHETYRQLQHKYKGGKRKKKSPLDATVP